MDVRCDMYRKRGGLDRVQLWVTGRTAAGFGQPVAVGPGQRFEGRELAFSLTKTLAARLPRCIADPGPVHEADTPDIFFTRPSGAGLGNAAMGSGRISGDAQGPELALAPLRDSPVGWAALYPGLSAGVADLDALWMQATGQCNRLLVVPRLALFARLVSVALYMALHGCTA